MVDVRRLLPPLALAGLAACSQAPDYRPPAITVPAAYKDAGPWVPASAPLAPSGQPWWQACGDPVLAGLEQRLDADNPGLALALARHDAAVATLRETRAQQFPTLDLGAQTLENRQSADRPLRGSNQPDLYAADTIGPSALYELDLWGRVRNLVASSRALADASADDIAVSRLALEGDLATTYLGLRGLDRQVGMLQATVDSYAKADALIRRRFQGGIASGIDVNRSGSQLADARGQLADVRNARSLAEHAIATLVGIPAAGFTLAPAPVTLSLPTVAVGVPSQLLQRRPDIAAAERRMYAANRLVGVARAASYPSITLGGSAGFQSTALAGLFAAPNLFWSIGPGAVLNLFDGGRRRAREQEAQAAWREATASYRLTVLGAFQQVEDGLSQQRYLAEEVDDERSAARQAGEAARISFDRYVKGAATYVDVVTAQTAQLAAERRALQVETQRNQSAVALVRALGGDWRS